MWSKPWSYKEGLVIGAGLLVIGILLQMAVGAINWGLIGFFRLDLVALVFGNMTWLSRIIYAVVGICGLYLISVYGRISYHVLGQA